MRSLSRFWASGGVVLVGDAAHTVTPALGQGLNSALEDCEQLAGELAAVTVGGLVYYRSVYKLLGGGVGP